LNLKEFRIACLRSKLNYQGVKRRKKTEVSVGHPKVALYNSTCINAELLTQGGSLALLT
jgi:hypothetical protein